MVSFDCFGVNEININVNVTMRQPIQNKNGFKSVGH